MDEVLIFANPIAGRGRGKAIALRLDARLRAEGYDVRLLLKKPELVEREDMGESPNSPMGPKAAMQFRISLWSSPAGGPRRTSNPSRIFPL